MSNEGPPPALLIRAAIKARRAVPDKDKLVEPADFAAENSLRRKETRAAGELFKETHRLV
jgi:hypothetical protein